MSNRGAAGDVSRAESAAERRIDVPSAALNAAALAAAEFAWR
jgi:hypothetical protein